MDNSGLVKIFCNGERSWAIRASDAWFCCLCGKKVKVVW